MPLSFDRVKPQNRHAKVLLIGEAGVGKSHAALTFPNPAVIDAEGSVDWFADRFSFVAVPTKSYADCRELVQQVRAGRVKCDSLVIDSLTSIYNGLVNAATQERQKQGSDDLRPLDWGRIKRKFSSLLDELYHQLPVNVVCVGWIKAEYAKPGDKVNGKTVTPQDLVKIGETFDGDRKTMYAFDFVIKILGNDGKKTRAEVIKTRSGGLKDGQIIPDFSWKTLEALMPKGESDYHGMTDEEQERRDAGVLEDVPGRVEQRQSSAAPRISTSRGAGVGTSTPSSADKAGTFPFSEPAKQNAEILENALENAIEKGRALYAVSKLRVDRHFSDSLWKELLVEMFPAKVSKATGSVSEGDLTIQELRDLYREANARTKFVEDKPATRSGKPGYEKALETEVPL